MLSALGRSSMCDWQEGFLRVLRRRLSSQWRQNSRGHLGAPVKEASRLCHSKGQSASGRVKSSYVPWDTPESQCLIRALLVKGSGPRWCPLLQRGCHPFNLLGYELTQNAIPFRRIVCSYGLTWHQDNSTLAEIVPRLELWSLD